MLLLENYTGIYDRSSEAACRIAVDFLLCECIAVMVSWLHISLAILLRDFSEERFLPVHRLSQPRTADVHQHLGILSKYTAKFHSRTKLILYRQSPRTPLSVVVLIMASELSSDLRKLLIDSFTRSYSASRPNSMAAFSTL